MGLCQLRFHPDLIGAGWAPGSVDMSAAGVRVPYYRPLFAATVAVEMSARWPYTAEVAAEWQSFGIPTPPVIGEDHG